MTNKLMQYKREANGNLYLYIKDELNSDWVRYTNHRLYTPDHSISSNSGFATSQTLLKRGYSFIKLED